MKDSTATIAFFVPGVPTPKARARHVRTATGVRSYTPKATARYEQQVASFGRSAMGDVDPLPNPIRLYLMICLPCPQSWSKARQEQACEGRILPTVKPDASNIVKSIEDGLNGVAYLDDSQIVELNVAKQYSATPGVHVRIDALDALPTPGSRQSKMYT